MELLAITWGGATGWTVAIAAGAFVGGFIVRGIWDSKRSSGGK